MIYANVIAVSYSIKHVLCLFFTLICNVGRSSFDIYNAYEKLIKRIKILKKPRYTVTYRSTSYYISISTNSERFKKKLLQRTINYTKRFSHFYYHQQTHLLSNGMRPTIYADFSHFGH